MRLLCAAPRFYVTGIDATPVKGDSMLLALPEQKFQHIFRHLAFVELRQGQVLYNTTSPKITPYSISFIVRMSNFDQRYEQ